MKKNISCIICVWIIITSVSGWTQEKIVLFTEEFPPFQYMKDKKITGVSAQILEAVMAKAKIEYEIKFYPWSRSYKYARERPNTFIFSISRLSSREHLFKWVGIIVPSQYSVFSLKTRTDIQLKRLEDAKKYIIGTTLNDARESYLLSKGFDLKNFDRVAGRNPNLQNYEKLKRGRIDLWPMPDAVAFHIIREMGDDPDIIVKKSYALDEISVGGYYLAANRNTSDELINKINTTLLQFKKTDAYTNILRRWGFNETSSPGHQR